MLDAARTALLVIDLQRDFLDPLGYAARAGVDVSRLRATLGPVCALIDAAREAGVRIVYTREGHRPDLSDCPAAKLARSRNAGAEIGSAGPLGRLLVRGEYGHDLIDELRALPDELIIDKPGYSAFAHTQLDFQLRTRGITDLVLCGVTTEVGVSSTLRSAVDCGYHCTLVSDACGSAYPELHAAALAMVEVEGGVFGRVCDSRQLLYEWSVRR